MPIDTLPFSTLISVDRTSAVPIFTQVANRLIALIRKGKLKPGYQLPASRDMAAMLQLNRTTVVAAYDELQTQGWIEAIPRKGNFVARQLPVISPKSFIVSTRETPKSQDQALFYRQIAIRQPPTRQLQPGQLLIDDGFPDGRIAPLNLITDRYKFLSDRVNVHRKLLAGGPGGSLSLRNELAEFLSKTRALDITPEQVLITSGAQLAIWIAANIILQPGSTVIVGDLNYALADRLFEQSGAKLIKVKVDKDGIDVDAIEHICKQSVPSLLYIIPHHHHPTTVTLSAERRGKLLDIIRRYRLPVIEDDYDYDFHYEGAPILPLASAEHQGYVLYIGSISKSLSPTVRLGYLIGGEDFVWQAARLKQVLAIRGDVLFEEAVAHLFSNGEIQKHIRRSVKLYKKRRDECCGILQASLGDRVKFSAPTGGMAIWTVFDPDYSLTQLCTRLATHGIFLNEGSIYPYKQDVKGIRLGFASLNADERELFAQALKKSR